MVLVWHDTGGENEFPERSTIPEQEEGHLRVGEASELLQEFSGFVNPFLCVLVAELWRADGTPQQLEVAVPPRDHITREVINDVGLRAGQRDELTFAGVQFQTDVQAFLFELLERLGH